MARVTLGLTAAAAHHGDLTVDLASPAGATVRVLAATGGWADTFSDLDARFAAASPLAWSDTTGVGDPLLNVAYRVVSRNGSGLMVGSSQLVGEVDFELVK